MGCPPPGLCFQCLVPYDAVILTVENLGGRFQLEEVGGRFQLEESLGRVDLEGILIPGYFLSFAV